MIQRISTTPTKDVHGIQAYAITTETKTGQTWSVVRTTEELVAFHTQIAARLHTKVALPIVEDQPSQVWGLVVWVLLFALSWYTFILESVLGFRDTVKWLGFDMSLLKPKFARASSKDLDQYFAALQGQGASLEATLTGFLETSLRPDWPPVSGPIDLARHDVPHSSARTEWWYFHSHVETVADKAPLSVFACFFRVLIHVDDNSGKKTYAHALTWAISDPTTKSYFHDVVLERSTPKTILASLKKKGKGFYRDPFLRRALQEILEKDNIPLPDRMFETPPVVANGSLHLNYSKDASLTKNEDGHYVLHARNPSNSMAIDLTFNPLKQPIRHGDNGIVPGRDGDEMFYYFIPRCEVRGTVKMPSSPLTKTIRGSGWYDHEFGGMEDNVLRDSDSASSDQQENEMDEHAYAWNWVAIQLNDGCEISAAVLYDPDGLGPSKPSILDLKAITIDETGTRRQYSAVGPKDHLPAADASGVFSSTENNNRAVTFETVKETEEDEWVSVRTFRTYPVRFKLEIPSEDIQLEIRASFPDQECLTIISKPAFWEGRCTVSGTKQGRPVAGNGFMERNGFEANQNISSFFKSVGKVVRKSVQDMYPTVPTPEQALNLVATEDTKHYMDGVPLDILGDTLIQPVRLVADRGGKSWRSYGALACVDCVGGDSREFVDWVAMPEFLHVGSLIVDDIQDRSETRRGGPCAHLVHGEPLCINAGTAAYFMCEQLIKAPNLTPTQLNQCYDLYFSALRGGHAGQALDIHGNDYLMDDVVATGDATLLEQRILAIHRLKTAVPAGTLARMGALVGGGTKEQIEMLGRFFESVGLAFQIMDDVLNLRGLYSKESDKLRKGTQLKRLGEDIVEGKVTMPVCKAMASMKSEKERAKLWEAIKSKPQDQAVVDAIIQQLEELDAIDECIKQSDELVEEAWQKLDPVIPDSFPKMMLRAFGWFVIERCG